MKVIITGASGFLGRNALLRAPRDWQIVALSHTSPLDGFVAEHGLDHVIPMRCDLRSVEDVKTVVQAVDGAADAVLLLAANSDPAVSADRPRWDLESNTTALVTFLEHCPAGHVVFVSSGAVYDGLIGNVTPATPVAPRLPYAISKLACEHYLRFFAERRGSVGSYINVRFFGAYGPYEAERKITTRWLRAMAQGQRDFVVRGDGKNLIDFMYVDDAVEGFLTLLAAQGSSATVDFASGMPASIDDVVHGMARALGITVTIRHEGDVPEYIQFRTVDATMRDRFGVSPSIPFEDGFARFHRFFAGEAHVAH
jgi:nucleoside-diphosphate-sugar epimerase